MKAVAQQLDEAAAQTVKESGSIDVEWGKVMRYQLGGEDIPGQRRLRHSGRKSACGLHSAPMHDGTRSQIHGETWVSMVAFGDQPKLKVLMSYGNSSQPGSPHITDQLPYLARKELRTAWRTRKDIEAHLESKVTF